MRAILTDVDSWAMAAVLAAAMLAGWGAGWWRRQRRTKAGGSPPAGKFNEATVALLGLLLGFTFSMSLGKHDERRMMVVTDSNSIGDFYTCASLVKEPVRASLQGLIRVYAERRLALTKEHLDEASLDKKLDDLQEMHGRMQTLVGEAVDGGTPIAVPLVNTFNEVTSSHNARLTAVRDQLPPSIVLLLFVSAVVAMGLTGAQQGASGEQPSAATLGFVALVSLVVWVTLDLNQPYRGMITVSQEPMQRVLSGISK